MKNFKRLKSLTIIALCSIMLVGFSGQEKFVELEGYLNGRSSAKFRRQDKNILSVLNTGTKGEILESKKMASGNYGLFVKVLSGANVGKKYWVYYNVKNPDLALYETAPQNWDIERNAASIENAQGTEVIRPTPAIAEPTPPPTTASGEGQQGVESGAPGLDPNAPLAYAPQPATVPPVINSALEAINNANKEVAPAPRALCPECLAQMRADYQAQVQAQKVSIAPERGNIINDETCSAIMNKDGEMGPIGRDLYGIMSEGKYKNHFLKSASLGRLCPRFNELSDNQKLLAWVWFWTSLGAEESQCRLNVTHGEDINPRVGYGIWTMEKSANYRRAHRGRACADISTGAGQGRCAIDIMVQTQLSEGETATSDSASYWGPVTTQRRVNNQMMPHMERFELCF